MTRPSYHQSNSSITISADRTLSQTQSMKLDIQFHLLLVHATGNKLLLTILQFTFTCTEHVRELSIRPPPAAESRTWDIRPFSRPLVPATRKPPNMRWNSISPTSMTSAPSRNKPVCPKKTSQQPVQHKSIAWNEKRDAHTCIPANATMHAREGIHQHSRQYDHHEPPMLHKRQPSEIMPSSSHFAVFITVISMESQYSSNTSGTPTQHGKEQP